MYLATMKRAIVAVLLGSIMVTLTFIPVANAEVVTPKWTDGDRFEYMGYDTFAIRNFENFVFNGTKPISVDKTDGQRLTIVYGSERECTRSAWEGNCGYAQQSHRIVMETMWENGSTMFESDLLNITIEMNVECWEPVDRIGIIPAFADCKYSWNYLISFTVGPEDNTVEFEAVQWNNVTYSGDWPETFRIGDSWTTEENVDREYNHRSRSNGGVWNETEIQSISEASTWSWTVMDEVNVYLGENADIKEEATRVQILEAGGFRNNTYWLDEEGYVVRNEFREDGVLLATLQLTDWTYSLEDQRGTQVSGGTGASVLFFGALITIVLLTGIGWIGWRAYNLVNEEIIDEVAERIVETDRRLRGNSSESDRSVGLLSRTTDVIDEQRDI